MLAGENRKEARVCAASGGYDGIPGLPADHPSDSKNRGRGNDIGEGRREEAKERKRKEPTLLMTIHSPANTFWGLAS